jgi:hypothetical protein
MTKQSLLLSLSSLLLCLSLVNASSFLDAKPESPISTVQGLITRMLGKKHVEQFELEIIPPAP